MTRDPHCDGCKADDARDVLRRERDELRAEVTRLVNDHEQWQRAAVASRRSICDLSDEYKARAENAEAAIRDALAVHRPSGIARASERTRVRPRSRSCHGCSDDDRVVPWPCATVEALSWRPVSPETTP